MTRPNPTSRSVGRSVLLASLILASCSGNDSGGQLATTVDEPVSDFQAENPEAIVLGSLEHVVTGKVDDVAAIPESFGRMGMSFLVERVDWQIGLRWYFGDRQVVEPLEAGDRIYVAVDQEWKVGKGDELTLALSMIPFADVDGYARVVIGSGAADTTKVGADEERDLGADTMRRYLSAASDIRGVSLAPTGDRRAQIDLLLELIADGRDWLDRQNRVPEGVEEVPQPTGLVAEVNSAVSPKASPPSLDAGLDPSSEYLLSVPPELRQLPLHPPDIAELSEALDVDLREVEGAVFDETRSFTFFALRFENVGVLGPWNTDGELFYGRIRGVAPRSGQMDILAWTVANDPQPGDAITIGRLEVPSGWDPDETALVLTVKAGDEVTSELITHVELTVRISEQLTVRDG
jgi:hypothetical protein